jgi:uncharacterized membrane protein YraQ (UPF0718 family)
MNDFDEIIRFVIGGVIHVLPFFVISISLSVLIRMLRLDGYIKKAFSHKIGIAILLATLIGAFSPLCSCTVIPVIGGLLSSGVPLAPIMAFWIASPTMDPEILALSVGILGWPLAIARLVSTLLLSLGAGYLTWILGKTWFLKGLESNKVKGNLPTKDCSCACDIDPVKRGEIKGNWKQILKKKFMAISLSDFIFEVLSESAKWGKWLLLAFTLEALIIQYIPQETVAQVLGNGSPLAIPFAALIGIPLYLTELTALPIVQGLLAQGMLPGAAIAFLIAGPVTTLPAMSAVFGIVHRRIFILYMVVGIGGSIFFGILSNLILSLIV